MRNSILFSLFIVLICNSAIAQQLPLGMNYQAVARDLDGQVISGQSIIIEISLFEQQDREGTEYKELHEIETNKLGLFNLVVGQGMPLQRSFQDVQWSTGEISIELGVDLDGDGEFQVLQSSKLLAVPYAYYSATAGSLVENDTSIDDTDLPQKSVISKSWVIVGNDGTDADIHFLGTGDSMALVFRTDSVERMRIDATGEVGVWKDMQVKGNLTASLFTGDGSGLTNLNLPIDGDNDPANELQILTQVGTDVTLSDGGGTVSILDDDSDPTNELQTIAQAGSMLTLSHGGGTIVLADDDNDPLNELQDLSMSGDTLKLSGDATPVILSGGFVDTDDQMLSLAGFELSITDGNTVTLPNSGGGGGLWSDNSPDVYYTGGNVGIGTSTPGADLEINSNSSLSDPQISLHEDGNDYARINFDNNNGSNYWTIASYIATNNKNDRLNFWNGTSGDLLSLTGDGRLGLNVGISPKTSFHVGNGHRVLFGIDTLGNGDKLMFLPDLHAFRVGTVATGAASTYWNRDSIGLYSFASGLNTRAQGFGATAMGRDTEATNSYAFASGFFCNADGQYSTAMGFNTDAFALGSTALGYSTDAEQNYSFAAGYFAEAQAIYSVAIGNAVRAQSYASMAVGRYNVGGGSSSSWISSDPIFEIGIGTGPSTRRNAVTVRKNGNVGIGTTVPLDRLHVNGRVRLQTVEYIEDGGTSEIAVRGDLRPSSNNVYDIGTSSLRWDDVYATSGTVNTSDRRDKTNIQDMVYGLDDVLKLKPVSYEWANSNYKSTKLGLIAQDLLEVIPEVVKTHDWEIGEQPGEGKVVELDHLGVYYSDIIPVLINAIQEQNAIVEEQRATISDLTDRVERMEKALLKIGVIEKSKQGKVAQMD